MTSPETALGAEPDAAWLSGLVARHSSDIAIVTDVRGRIVWANEAFEEISEYRLADVIGHKPGELLQGAGTDPDTVRACRRALAATSRFEAEILNYSRSGKPYWLHMRIDPVFARDGAHTHFIAIERDVTARKQAEEHARLARERLDIALDSGSDAMWCVEPGGGRSHFTAGSRSRLKRYARPEGAVDRFDLVRLVHPDDRDEVRRRLSAHLDGEDLDISVRLRTDAGDWGWFQCRGRLMAAADGFPACSIGLVSDITRFRSAQERAEDGERAKAELLAYAAHEIRNLLNGLAGTTQLLLWSGLDGRPAELVQRLQKNCEMLNKLVTQSLDLTRIEAGLLRLKAEPFRLRPLVEDVAQALVDQANAKGLELRTEFGMISDTCLEGDRDCLQQVLLNLVSNAIKFTPRGRVTVSVTRAASGDVAFAVTDTGPGIAAAEQSTIFERFRQAGDGRGGAGSGLGLHIASRLVRLMGGRIAVDSEVGQGARFSFAVPLPTASENAAADLRAERRGPARPVARLGAARVLLAEDDADAQALVSEMLGVLGITDLTLAGSGEAAVGVAVKRPFDLMIFDQNLPGMSGADAIDHLRTFDGLNRRTEIIVLSGARPGGEIAGYPGVTVLAKPMDPGQFLGIVQHLLT